MTKNQQVGLLTILAALGSVCVVFFPNLLNDRNSFLKAYVTHEMFAVFAGFAAISLPIIGLYLDILKNSDRLSHSAFWRLKSAAQKAAKWICSLLAICFVLAYAKGFVGDDSRVLYLDAAALVNFFAIMLNAVLIIVLYDVVSALLETY